jgi:hypothetical protein
MLMIFFKGFGFSFGSNKKKANFMVWFLRWFHQKGVNSSPNHNN